jgi:S1-C subfamily serine protease
MNQTPWSRNTPPKPPSSPIDKTGLGGSPNAAPRQTPPGVGPPSRPSSSSVQPSNATQYKSLKTKRSIRASGSGVKRVASAFAAVALFIGAAFLINGVLGSSSNQDSITSDTLVEAFTPDLTLPPIDSEAGKANWDALAGSVVFIEALDPCNWRGSGTLVLDGSYVLTNEHVASDGTCELVIGLTNSLSSEPSGDLNAIVIARDADIDLAVLRLIDSAGNPVIPAGHKPVTIDYGQPLLGSKLTTLGYPALGNYEAGMTITYTSGDFSGIDNSAGEFYKTTAQMRGGVSGGAAFNERGLFIGIPTAGLIDEDTGEAVGINLIRPAKYAKPLLEQAQSNPLGALAVSSSADSGSGGNYDAQTDPPFATCREAKANGYGPYYAEFDSEYDWYWDADSDGVVCE